MLLWGGIIQHLKPDCVRGFMMGNLRQSVAEDWSAGDMREYLVERRFLDLLPTLHESWWL